jgi:hypothetical protein
VVADGLRDVAFSDDEEPDCLGPPQVPPLVNGSQIRLVLYRHGGLLLATMRI